jgi:teichoic acid transport system ATP-binding protein
MKPSIVVEDLSKIYHLYNSPQDRLRETLRLTRKSLHRDFFALKNVSFSVYPGETVGIIGKNGAGKSTLLKIITGVLNPSGGSVEITGKISALLELGAGFNLEYTGLENVYLNGTIMGYSRSEMDERLPKILDFADIGEFIYQPVKSYSSGMFMRLAFSVAINVDPEILIVDEALSVGDILFQTKCFKKIQEFKESGKTILFVSHSLNNIIQYCDRCIVLSEGEKVAEGEAAPMVDLFKQILTTPQDQKAKIVSLVNSYSVISSTDDITQTLKEKLILNKDFLEYGSHELEIIDFAIVDAYGHISNVIDSKKSFQVIMRIRALMEKNMPIFAFSIKDIHGVEITGTNTMYNNVDTGTLMPGDCVEITFTQTIPLPGNGYVLSLGCTGFEGDNFVVYHRLYDIAPIETINEKQMVGYFDPDSTISLKKY